MKNRFFFVLLISLSFSSYESYAAAVHAGTKSGRFQIIQLSEMRRDQYLIDTETGQIWSHVCAHKDASGECDFLYWSKDTVEGVNVSPLVIAETLKNIDNPDGAKPKKTKSKADHEAGSNN